MKKDEGNMMLSMSYSTVDFQNGSGTGGIERDGFEPISDQLLTKQPTSISFSIAMTFYLTKKIFMAHKNINVLVTKSCI